MGEAVAGELRLVAFAEPDGLIGVDELSHPAGIDDDTLDDARRKSGWRGSTTSPSRPETRGGSF